MTSYTYFKEEIEIRHWDKPGLEGFIYKDVFEPFFFNNLKNLVKSTLDLGQTKTYLTHQTTFNVDGNNFKIVSHAQNGREQCVVFDLTFLNEWYYQTNDTVKSWSDNQIMESVSPLFVKCMKTIENLHPFSSQPDEWVFYRLHFNYLEPNKLLALHTDSAPHITRSYEGCIDHLKANMYSFTCYFYDHVEGKGGEFWTPNGFVYKPKANTALCIQGNKGFHGVTENIDEKPRLAFTFRLVHKDDLYLPGSPDKFLYDVSKNTL